MPAISDELADLHGLLDQIDANDDVIASNLTKEPAQLQPVLTAGPALRPTISEEKPGLIGPSEAVVAVTPEVSIIPPSMESIVNLEKHYQRLDAVTEEVLCGVRSDRAEAQEVINMMRDRVTANIDAPRVYVESLVKAMEVKSNINTSAIKILEVGAKLLAATRASTLIQNNNNNNINVGGLAQEAEFARILNASLSDDDV